MASSSWTETLRTRLLWTVAALGLALVAWHVGSMHRQVLLDDRRAAGRQELDLYASHLSGQLNRFAYLPALLADDFRLQSLLIAPGNVAQRNRVNRVLEHVNAIAGALDVYLMDREGLTVAASNWRAEQTFVGRNFAFRPYFAKAMAGNRARYYALGTTSGRRGYYFAHPVGEAEDPLGVVVVKVDIDTLENAWRGRGSELVVTDPDGIVFVSTRADWRYLALLPLDADTTARIRASRRYPDAALAPIFGAVDGVMDGGDRWLRFAGDTSGRMIGIARDMPEVGWRVQMLIPGDVAAAEVWRTRLFALTVLVLVTLVGWSYAQRRRRLREQEQARREAMQGALADLERRVSQRTRALTEANLALREEAKRHETTRDELIQAAKLAALGQMSAGINHELNQPLAAMRTYADNALAFLERERFDKVGWNLVQIRDLTRRMSQISGQLKVFSRKSSGQRSRVSVLACLDGAQRILAARLARADVTLTRDLPAGDLFVAADMVQLEQVLVNLVGNACDVLAGRSERRVSVTGCREGDRVRVRIADTGPGIADDDLERVFDPFFTTNDAGLGLGLSISHTIAQRLGGSLSAANGPTGGAVFTLTLESWSDCAVEHRPAGAGG